MPCLPLQKRQRSSLCPTAWQDSAARSTWLHNRTHAVQRSAHGEAREGKLGGFNEPTQDVSGACGSARNERITARAQGGAGATTCPTPGVVTMVAFDRFAPPAFPPAREVNGS